MKPKKSKRQAFVSTSPFAASIPQLQQLPKQPSFLSFVFSRPNRMYLLLGIGISLVYFILLRILYPIPSCYSDSFTYLQVAQDHRKVSFRPVEYSYIINLFKAFSTSDIALIFGQYFSNVFANLLLFFTSTYFLSFRKGNKILLFILLLLNPLYVMYSNYILTDAFFGAFTVMWFVTLLWVMYRPRWYYTVIQLLLLAILFKLRYNAIVFPVIVMLALYLSKQKLRSKLASLGVSLLLIIALVIHTIYVTEKETHIRTFSAFSGWQMANNAMHVLRFQKADTTVEDAEQKKLAKFVNRFNDTTSVKFDSLTAHSGYMWNARSPLKAYIPVYAKANNYPTYFLAWTALGDVYSKFGKHIILKNPGGYLQHFVLPNTKAYFIPDLEAYSEYFTRTDTLPLRMQHFYGYPTRKVGPQHEWAYTLSFKPWRYLFPIVNILFLVVAGAYYATKRFKNAPPMLNNWLSCFLFFYVVNFFFIVLLAPSVFRYHVFIITLIFPLLIYLLQQFIKPKMAMAA